MGAATIATAAAVHSGSMNGTKSERKNYPGCFRKYGPFSDETAT